MPKITPLPKFNFTIEDLDRSQAKVVAKLQEYLDFKKSKIDNKEEQQKFFLPFSTTNGLCSGLVAYWLYCKSTREEWEFIDKLEYILTWDETKVRADDKKDRKIEDFMNTIEFLQFDTEIRRDIREADLDQTFKILLPEHAQQVAPVEFQFTFVFNIGSLGELLNKAIEPNKMTRLSNAYHTIGVVYSDGIYYLYDPEAEEGPVPYDNNIDLSNAIFKSLAAFDKSEEYIALNMSIFDLASEKRGDYPDPNIYCRELLGDPEYKQALIKNPHIFDLAMWYKNDDLANYLIQEGMDLNSKSPKGRTPLEIALIEKHPSMLYSLLADGANPNALTSKNISLLEFAIQRKNSDAIIMLLAFGAECSKGQKELLYSKFNFSSARGIIANAIELNQILLRSEEWLNLDVANSREILVFLRSAKLKTQVGLPIDSIEIKVAGKNLIGVAALNKIITHCQKIENSDLFDCAQKTEILELLKYHLPSDFKSDGDQELLNILSAIEKNIKTRDIKNLSKDNLLEISIILDHLSSISTHWATIYPKRIYICYKADALRRDIEQYLAGNGIDSLTDKISELQVKAHDHQRNYLFFSPEKGKVEQEISYNADVAPLLKM